MILFLNKVDIFKEKLSLIPVSTHFTDFAGGPDYNLACKYFEGIFLLTDCRPKRKMHVFFTDATDVRSFQPVLQDLETIILQDKIRT